MIIAFQGIVGAYSHQVCRRLYPNAVPLACATFEDVFAALDNGQASHAIIPVENSIAGRVADVYYLLPHSRATIIGEHIEKIQHCLLAPHHATLETIREVHSHIQGLSQCREFIRAHGWKAVVHADTAGAAKDISTAHEAHKAAIAGSLAAEIYDLKILSEGIADAAHNATRFLVLSGDEVAWPSLEDAPAKIVSTLIFSVKSVPAALYKCLGGFATNGINLVKIESYLLDGSFTAARFHIDVEGHPDSAAMRHALMELKYYAQDVRILGVYERANPL